MARTSDTRSISRRKAFRRQRSTILIVCEGEKTEPNYFEFFRRDLRLSSVDVKICGNECGSDPLSVVTYASERFCAEPDIDLCFCVIDRDTHDANNLQQARMKAEAVAAKVDGSRCFELHISYPSIEYWFILHYKFVRAPFVASRGKSLAEVAAKLLSSLMPGGYSKNDKDIGKKLHPLVDHALTQSVRAHADAIVTGEMNPSTTLHLVVRRLLELKTH